MNIENLELDGLKLIKPHLFEDHRGLYRKYYEIEQFRAFGWISAFGRKTMEGSSVLF